MAEKKPQVFIGSSAEAVDIADELASLMHHKCHPYVWHTAFGASKIFIDCIEKALNDCEFGVFILSEDDTVVSRGSTEKMTRDNVIFEAGAFVGRHGRKRVFFVLEKGNNLKIPSDLEGVGLVYWDPNNKNRASALNVAKTSILKALEEIVEEEKENPPQAVSVDPPVDDEWESSDIQNVLVDFFSSQPDGWSTVLIDTLVMATGVPREQLIGQLKITKGLDALKVQNLGKRSFRLFLKKPRRRTLIS